ncbi:unnamed protein product, partial [Phaeothamnion confervicola]
MDSFFTRDRDAAISDMDQWLKDYKRQELEALAGSLGGSSSGGGSSKEGSKVPFRASGALMFVSFDRGQLLYGETGYESTRLVQTVPVPLGGFFANGVIGQ